MTAETPKPTYDELADCFWRLGVMSSPSQLHGYLMGLLAVGHPLSDDRWLALATTFIDPVQSPAEAERMALLELLEHARAELEEGGMELRLLLPDDAVEMVQRVDALGQWCRGFMAGFAYGGREQQSQHGQQQYSQDVSDALRDIAAISQAGLGEGDEDEQERERSFFEVGEYLRLAAITIYLECERARSAEPAPAQSADPTASPANLFAPKSGGDKLH